MDTIHFWDRMSAKYDDISIRRYQKAYDATVALSRKHLKPTDTVLDFACGTGLTTVQLAGSVSSVLAIDTSPKMIALAQDKCAGQGAHNVTFAVTTLFDNSLTESSFDAVLAFNILHGLPEVHEYCTHIHRLIKPGGLFLSATDCLKEAGIAAAVLIKTLQLFNKMPPHVSLMSRKDIVTLIESAGFSILETQNLFEMPPNLFVAAQRI